MSLQFGQGFAFVHHSISLSSLTGAESASNMTPLLSWPVHYLCCKLNWGYCLGTLGPLCMRFSMWASTQDCLGFFIAWRLGSRS